MKTALKVYMILFALIAFTLSQTADANIVLTDDASNYTSGTWTNGSNQGSGFGAWTIAAGGGSGGFAGAFIGDSSLGLSGSTALNTGTADAFGLYQNQAADGFVQIDRTFAGGALEVGESFSIDMGVNFRSGYRGLNLVDSSDGDLFTFLVGNIGSGDEYYYQDNANGGTNETLGLAYQGDSIFTLTFDQTTATDMNVTIERNSSSSGLETPLNSVFTLSDASGISIFYNNNGNNFGDSDNFYFNNLSVTVIPEPATLGLILSGFGLLSLVRRFRS